MQIATKKMAREAILVGLISSLLLTWGAIPASARLAEMVTALIQSNLESTALIKRLFFPLVSAGLYFSIPRPNFANLPSLTNQDLLLHFPIPFLVSFIFGWLTPNPPLLQGSFDDHQFIEAIWFFVSVPIGEELLFRGWLFSVVETRTRGARLSLTHPFPLAVWITAAGFSIWHLQNLDTSPFSIVLFQVVYTFFTGVWLGYLRYSTRKIWVPMLFHASLNIASNLC